MCRDGVFGISIIIKQQTIIWTSTVNGWAKLNVRFDMCLKLIKGRSHFWTTRTHMAAMTSDSVAKYQTPAEAEATRGPCSAPSFAGTKLLLDNSSNGVLETKFCLRPRLHQDNMLPVSRQRVSLCIQEQTGNKLATILLTATSNMLPATCCRATCCLV